MHNYRISWTRNENVSCWKGTLSIGSEILFYNGFRGRRWRWNRRNPKTYMESLQSHSISSSSWNPFVMISFPAWNLYLFTWNRITHRSRILIDRLIFPWNISAKLYTFWVYILLELFKLPITRSLKPQRSVVLVMRQRTLNGVVNSPGRAHWVQPRLLQWLHRWEEEKLRERENRRVAHRRNTLEEHSNLLIPMNREITCVEDDTNLPCK